MLHFEERIFFLESFDQRSDTARIGIEDDFAFFLRALNFDNGVIRNGGCPNLPMTIR
jgi:hypothetical protein